MAFPWLVSSEWLHYGYALVMLPTSVAQLVVPRVELHLFYNAVVFIPMVVAMYLHLRPRQDEPAREPAHRLRLAAHPGAVVQQRPAHRTGPP